MNGYVVAAIFAGLSVMNFARFVLDRCFRDWFNFWLGVWFGICFLIAFTTA